MMGLKRVGGISRRIRKASETARARIRRGFSAWREQEQWSREYEERRRAYEARRRQATAEDKRLGRLVELPELKPGLQKPAFLKRINEWLEKHGERIAARVEAYREEKGLPGDLSHSEILWRMWRERRVGKPTSKEPLNTSDYRPPLRRKSRGYEFP